MIAAPLNARKLHLLVRLDANHQIGMGHAVRVSAILRLLRTQHYVTVIGEGELIADLFSGLQIVSVNMTDPNSFPRLIREIKPDLVLVDHPQPGHEFWRQLRESDGNIPVVAIDDEGGDVDADLIINGEVLDRYHHYPLLRPRSRLLAGQDYALIRPIFAETPWHPTIEPSVVIVAGSADRARDWALQLTSGVLDMRNWGKVRVIVGRAFPDLPRLQSNCDNLGVTLESGLSGENMAQALAQANVALITGGMILYEAIAVGVPAVVFPQVQNMVPVTQWFAERGCIVDLGYGGGTNSRLIAETVGRLLDSSSARLAMSSTQRSTIDGRGMKRVAAVIDNLLATSKPSVVQSGDESWESP